MELRINRNVAGLRDRKVEGYVTKKLRRSGFRRSLYTNVIYVFPAAVHFVARAAAYAQVNGYLSVFKDHYVSQQYVLMHEIAHNFGHNHSGQGDYALGDDSCMQGVQQYANNAPRACFNGAKSWWFNWYSDRHVTVIPTSTSMYLNMLSINDYLNDEANSIDQYTVARIVGHTETDLFVMYNRAEGVNSQVSGHRDQVTIVEQSGASEQSWLKAGLSEDGLSHWRKRNWDGSGKTLVIQVCNIVSGSPDYARVIVYLEGVNDLSCDNHSPPSTCPSGFSKFNCAVKTDAFGDEVGWWLKEKDSSGRFNIILKDGDFANYQFSSKEKCIDDSKCYKFKIKDDGGDGLCCAYGRGWYHIIVDSKLL